MVAVWFIVGDYTWHSLRKIQRLCDLIGCPLDCQMQFYADDFDCC